MRRIVNALAVLGAVALSGCGGGGSVLNLSGSSSVDRVIVTTIGSSNIARVLPGASIALSAIAVQGSQNGYVNANQFIWSAAVLTSGQYVANTDGGTRACGNLSFTPTGSTASPYAQDYGVYIAIDPTNESNILFTPPTTVPFTFPAGSGTIAVNYPYCVAVTATSRGGGSSTAGSITVAVVNPQNPLQ